MSGCPLPTRRLCKIGVSLLLCVSAGSLCAGKPPSPAASADPTDQAFWPEQMPVAVPEAHAPLLSECELALRHAYEVAPEVLALASWPLDSSEPAACEHPGVTVHALDLPDFPAARALEFAALATVSPGAATQAAQATDGNVGATPGALSPNPLGHQLVALDDGSLDEIRGGFELADSNLKFSFGIERAVFINGQLVASTVLNVKDLQLAAGSGSPQVSVTSGVPGTVAVVQNGNLNGLATQVGASLAGTVLQNSLDNQRIQNVTTINATVNASQILRGMSVQSAVQNGIINSLRR